MVELEDLVAKLDAPQDPSWAVWADALQAAGDPRGELIALERIPEAKRSLAQRERLTLLHRPYTERFEAAMRGLLPGGWLERWPPTWRHGFVTKLALSMGLPGPTDLTSWLADELFRGLRSLELWILDDQLDDLVEAIVEARPPLSELVLVGTDYPFACVDADDCARLWAALPRLRHLQLAAMAFERLDHPGLASLSVVTGMMDAQQLGRMLRSELPALEELELVEIPQAPSPELGTLSFPERTRVERVVRSFEDAFPARSSRTDSVWIEWPCGSARVPVEDYVSWALRLNYKQRELGSDHHAEILGIASGLDLSRRGHRVRASFELLDALFYRAGGEQAQAVYAAVEHHRSCCSELFVVVVDAE